MLEITTPVKISLKDLDSITTLITFRRFNGKCKYKSAKTLN